MCVCVCCDRQTQNVFFARVLLPRAPGFIEHVSHTSHIVALWLSMVLYTEKDRAADHDPRRFHILPPPGVAGTIDADVETLQRAYSFLEEAHRAPCSLGQTPLVVQRLPVLGIANDVNYIVRALALAMRKKHGGQLIQMPV